jgi:hypothetical protein
LAILTFRRRAGPCPALVLDAADGLYRCGLIERPPLALRWLPLAWRRTLVLRWIAAGQGCDSSA